MAVYPTTAGALYYSPRKIRFVGSFYKLVDTLRESSNPLGRERKKYFYFFLLPKTKGFDLPMVMFGLSIEKSLRCYAENGSSQDGDHSNWLSFWKPRML